MEEKQILELIAIHSGDAPDKALLRIISGLCKQGIKNGGRDAREAVNVIRQSIYFERRRFCPTCNKRIRLRHKFEDTPRGFCHINCDNPQMYCRPGQCEFPYLRSHALCRN